jgi:hypothetical protein
MSEPSKYDRLRQCIEQLVQHAEAAQGLAAKASDDASFDELDAIAGVLIDARCDVQAAEDALTDCQEDA